MITKQQALEFIDELSKEFAIKMDLTSGVDCYFEVYSDEAGTHRLEGNFDSTEEVITELMRKYINTNLFENIGIVPVDISMLEIGKTYKVVYDDYGEIKEITEKLENIRLDDRRGQNYFDFEKSCPIYESLIIEIHEVFNDDN